MNELESLKILEVRKVNLFNKYPVDPISYFWVFNYKFKEKIALFLLFACK